MFDVIGFIGMTLILFAFIMNQTHRWKDDSLAYDGVNAVGGAIMIVYALFINSYPFLILNVVWTAVSIRDVYIDIKKKK